MKTLGLIVAATLISSACTFAADCTASCAIPAKVAPAVTAPAAEPAVVASGTTATKPAELAIQTTCPIMKGKAINKNLFVDYEGQRIYVCCGGCLADVKKNPQSAIAELKKEGQKPAAIPAKK